MRHSQKLHPWLIWVFWIRLRRGSSMLVEVVAFRSVVWRTRTRNRIPGSSTIIAGRTASKHGIGIDSYSFNFLHNGEDSVTKPLYGRMAVGRDCFDLVSGTHSTLPGCAREICGRWASVRNTNSREYLTISVGYVDLSSTYSHRDARDPCDKKPIRVRRAVSLSAGYDRPSRCCPERHRSTNKNSLAVRSGLARLSIHEREVTP